MSTSETQSRIQLNDQRYVHTPIYEQNDKNNIE